MSFKFPRCSLKRSYRSILCKGYNFLFTEYQHGIPRVQENELSILSQKIEIELFIITNDIQYIEMNYKSMHYMFSNYYKRSVITNNSSLHIADLFLIFLLLYFYFLLHQIFPFQYFVIELSPLAKLHAVLWSPPVVQKDLPREYPPFSMLHIHMLLLVSAIILNLIKNKRIS